MRKLIVLACVAGTSYYIGRRRDYFVACAKAGAEMGRRERPFTPSKTAEEIWDKMYKS